MTNEPVAEEFRPVVGYEGIYEVSNIGTVKSVERVNSVGKHVSAVLLKQSLTKDGYLRVQLSKGGVRKSFRVHRLVAQAFIPNPDNLPQVNHKDENKLKNEAINLEWCTAEYNTNYGTRNARALINFDYEKRNLNKQFKLGVENSAKNRRKSIVAKLKSGEIKHFESIREAVANLSVSESSIIMVLKGRWKKCKGIEFYYEEEWTMTNPLTEAVQLAVED